MNFENDEIALTTKFKSEFEQSHPSVKVDWPGVTTPAHDGEPLVRFRIIHADSRTVGMGGSTRRIRNYGSVMVQILVPQGRGQAAALKLADRVSAIYNRYRSGGLFCRTASIGGVVESGKHLMVNVLVPYQSDFSA